MNNEFVKKKYKKKIKEFIKHNRLYFDKNKPQVSDKYFDELKKEKIQ